MSARTSRRMVLRGAAGFTLAIPFLSSLAPRGAEAGGPASTRKRFVAMATDHGSIWQSNMYPAESTLGQATTYAGAERRRGDLALDVAGTVASLSPVLSASAARFTPALAAKMNVLRGLDVPFYLAHHRGGHLGNYANNDQNGTDGAAMTNRPRPTIDQVLAWSDQFYPDLATIKERALIMGGHGMSATWSSPSTQSGEIQNITPQNDSLALFDAIFVAPEVPGETRPLIVDRIHADYTRLRQHSRLSAGDRQRLADHLDRIDELQRKLNVTVSCGDVDRPATSSIEETYASSWSVDPAAHRRFWQLMNDVVAVAFACDTCRIVTMKVGEIFSTYEGDWHQDIAHQAMLPDGQSQAVIAAAHQRFFEDVFLDLVAKLDAIEETEGTALDSALVQWTHEAGAVTHDPIELPVVTAGSAGGFLTTGSYADYRDLGKTAALPGEGNAVSSHIGLIYNQWLGTALQAMGVPRDEFEQGTHGGYGEVQLSTESWYSGYGKYDAELDVMSDVLPFLRA